MERKSSRRSMVRFWKNENRISKILRHAITLRILNWLFFSRVLFCKFLKILVENITGESFKRLEKRRRQSTDQSIDSILNNLLYTRVCMYDYHFPFFFFLCIIYTYSALLSVRLCVYIYRICVLSEKARCTEERSLFIYLFFFIYIYYYCSNEIHLFECIYIYIYLQEFVWYIYIATENNCTLI